MATTLAPMRPAAFEAFVQMAVTAYAADNIASGRWPAEDAWHLARAETQRLLPRGLQTPDHHFFEIVEGEAGPTVGHLWLAELERGRQRVGYVYQLLVLEPYRRQGHGRAALLAVEPVARRLGLSAVALNVFGHNTGAQALYRALGYGVVSLALQKDLAAPGA